MLSHNKNQHRQRYILLITRKYETGAFIITWEKAVKENHFVAELIIHWNRN